MFYHRVNKGLYNKGNSYKNEIDTYNSSIQLLRSTSLMINAR